MITCLARIVVLCAPLFVASLYGAAKPSSQSVRDSLGVPPIRLAFLQKSFMKEVSERTAYMLKVGHSKKGDLVEVEPRKIYFVSQKKPSVLWAFLNKK